MSISHPLHFFSPQAGAHAQVAVGQTWAPLPARRSTEVPRRSTDVPAQRRFSYDDSLAAALSRGGAAAAAAAAASQLAASQLPRRRRHTSSECREATAEAEAVGICTHTSSTTSPTHILNARFFQ
jgi:hypothetical protein